MRIARKTSIIPKKVLICTPGMIRDSESALFFGLWAVQLEGGIAESIAPVTRLLLFAGVLGYVTTMAGMEFFLFRFDNSHPLKQVFWFCVMLLPMLGPALYCFIVYSRSDVLKSRPRAEDVPK